MPTYKVLIYSCIDYLTKSLKSIIFRVQLPGVWNSVIKKLKFLLGEQLTDGNYTVC